MDPDARMYRKSDGHPAQLVYMGHVLMENRSGLVVDTDVTPADGYGERRVALTMLKAPFEARLGRPGGSLLT